MQSILIRTDATTAIGTGHVMRMIALAQGWQDNGGAAHMATVSCPEPLVERLHTENVYHQEFSVCECGGTEDARQTIELARKIGAEWVVLDGYHFVLKYQRAIHENGLKVMVMDDYGHCEKWCADLILNQNIGCEERQYDNELPGAKVLLGLQFTLLRREFFTAVERLQTAPSRGPVYKLILTFGGADANNVTGKVLEALDMAIVDGLDIGLVIGPGNPHRETLERQAAQSRHKVQILENVTDMPALYAWADGIVSAGGSTCYEWLLFGLKGAVVTIADNQRPIVDGLAATGDILTLGEWSKSTPEDWAARIGPWLHRKDSTSKPMPLPLEGLGSDRVAAYLAGRFIYLRKGLWTDVERTWRWANEPLARQMSFQSERIPYEEHSTWWRNKLSNGNAWVRIVELGGVGPIGIIRFEKGPEDAHAVISVNVSESFRSKGLGTSIIRIATHDFVSESGLKEILAYAKISNTASARAFQKAGYSAPRPARTWDNEAVVMSYSSRESKAKIHNAQDSSNRK
jgi:UDP-2,4-diacetamido-2,4,6-trideoxy-beta-L-altropyranose hydrolase